MSLALSLKRIFTKPEQKSGSVKNLPSPEEPPQTKPHHTCVNYEPGGSCAEKQMTITCHGDVTERVNITSSGKKCLSQTSNDSAFSSMGYNLVDSTGRFDVDSITSLEEHDGSISDGELNNKTSLDSSMNCTKSHENLFDRKDGFMNNGLEGASFNSSNFHINNGNLNNNNLNLGNDKKESANSSTLSIFDPSNKQGGSSSIENSQTGSIISKLTNVSTNPTPSTPSRLSLTRSTSHDTCNSNEQLDIANSNDYDDKNKRGLREKFKKINLNRRQASVKERQKVEKQDKYAASKFDGSPRFSQTVPVMDLKSYDVCITLPFNIGLETDFEVVPECPFLNENLPKMFSNDGCILNKIATLQSCIRSKDSIKRSEQNLQRCVLKGLVTMKGKPKYLFLFQEFLLVAKQKTALSFKLKNKVDLSIIWLTGKEVESAGSPSSYPNQSTILIGWPTEGNVTNYFIRFPPGEAEKKKWLDAINSQKDQVCRKYTSPVIIKIHCVDKTFGNRTKKLTVSRDDSIDDVFRRIPKEFLPNANTDMKYHFCVKFMDDADARSLTGHESLYCIQLASDLSIIRNKVDHFSIVQSKGNVRSVTSRKIRRSRKNMTPQDNVVVVVDHVHSSINQRKPSSQLFGCALHQLCSNNDNNLPKIIMKLLEHLYKFGPLAQGVFRKCNNHKELQSMISSLDTRSNKNDVDVVKDMSVHMTAALIKCWLIKMPECLLVSSNYYDWLNIEEVKDRTEKILKTKKLIGDLPPSHLTLLKYLLCVLHRITTNSSHNLMTSHNLSVCLSPSILRPSNTVSQEKEAETIELANKVVKWLIDSAEEVLGKKECIDLFEEYGGVQPGMENVDDVKKGFGSPVSRMSQSYLNLKELEEFGTKLTRSSSCEQLDSMYLLPSSPADFLGNNNRATSLDNLDHTRVSYLKKTISPDSGISGSTEETDKKLLESPVFNKEQNVDIVQRLDGLDRIDDEAMVSRCDSETSEENEMETPRINSFYLNFDKPEDKYSRGHNLSDEVIASGDDDEDDNVGEKEDEKNADYGANDKQPNPDEKSENRDISNDAYDSDNTMTKSSSFLNSDAINSNNSINLSRNTSVIENNKDNSIMDDRDNFDEVDGVSNNEDNHASSMVRISERMIDRKEEFELLPCQSRVSSEKTKLFHDNLEKQLKAQLEQKFQENQQQQQQKSLAEPQQQQQPKRKQQQSSQLIAQEIVEHQNLTSNLQQQYQTKSKAGEPVEKSQPKLVNIPQKQSRILPQERKEQSSKPQQPQTLLKYNATNSHQQPSPVENQQQKLQRQKAFEYFDYQQNDLTESLTPLKNDIYLEEESQQQQPHQQRFQPQQQHLQLHQIKQSQHQSHQQSEQHQQQRIQPEQQQQQPHQIQQPQQQPIRLQQKHQMQQHRLLAKSISSNSCLPTVNVKFVEKPPTMNKYCTSMHIQNINIVNNHNNDNNDNMYKHYYNNKFLNTVQDDEFRCSSVRSDCNVSYNGDQNYNSKNNIELNNNNNIYDVDRYNTLNSHKKNKPCHIVEVKVGNPRPKQNNFSVIKSEIISIPSIRDTCDKGILRHNVDNDHALGNKINDPNVNNRFRSLNSQDYDYELFNNSLNISQQHHRNTITHRNLENSESKKQFRTTIYLGSSDVDHISYHDDVHKYDYNQRRCQQQHYQQHQQQQQDYPQQQGYPQQLGTKILNPQEVMNNRPRPNSRVSRVIHYVDDHRNIYTRDDYNRLSNDIINNSGMKLENNKVPHSVRLNDRKYNNYSPFNYGAKITNNLQGNGNSTVHINNQPSQIYSNNIKLLINSDKNESGVQTVKDGDVHFRSRGVWQSTINL